MRREIYFFIFSKEKLLRALRGGDVEKVKRYIEWGLLEPNERLEEGKRPLHYSAKCSYGLLTEYLLTLKGINIEATDDNGLTPLMLAAISVNVRPCEHLIAHGADYEKKYRNKTFLELFDASDSSGLRIDYLKTAIAKRKAFLEQEKHVQMALDNPEEKIPLTKNSCLHSFKDFCKKLSAKGKTKGHYFSDSDSSQDNLLPVAAFKNL